jgi:hypothetical protein
MIAMLSRSSAAHRARSRVNEAAKDSARVKIAHAAAASRAFLRRPYHAEPLTPDWMAIFRRLGEREALRVFPWVKSLGMSKKFSNAFGV